MSVGKVKGSSKRKPQNIATKGHDEIMDTGDGHKPVKHGSAGPGRSRTHADHKAVARSRGGQKAPPGRKKSSKKK